MCQNFGIYAAVLMVMVVVVAATSVAVVRLNDEADSAAEYDASMAEQVAEDTTNSNRFSFLLGYALELVFALFIFYFITSTIFFSGILGCFRIPVLGGRPYELRREKNKSGEDDQQSDDEGFAPGLQLYDV